MSTRESLRAELVKHPLHVAVLDNDIDAVKTLIARGARHCRVATGAKWTPMAIAIEFRRIEMIKLLVQAGDGFDELFAANEDESIIAQLIEHGLDVSMTDSLDGRSLTFCYFAAQNNNEKVLAALLQAGAPCGDCAAHVAAGNENDKVLALLIDVGVDFKSADSQGWAPIHIAAERGNERVLGRLVDAGVSIETEGIHGVTLCHHAARNSNAAVMAWLIAAGCDVNSRGGSDENPLPVHVAAQNENEEVMRLLIDAKANISARDHYGRSPLHLAVLQGNEKVFDLLVAAGGASTNGEHTDNKWTSLCHAAVASRKESLLKKIIALGFDVNALAEGRETPCHWAAKYSNVACLRALIAAGASFDAWSGNCSRLLHCAAANEDVGVVELVLSLGGNLDARDFSHRSPCHVAAEFCRGDNLLALVNAGAPITALTREGDSVLHAAAANERYARGRRPKSVVRLLLQLGANSQLSNDRGVFPAHIASVAGLAVLFGHGIDIRPRVAYMSSMRPGRALLVATLFAAGAMSDKSVDADEINDAIETKTIAEQEWLLFQLRSHQVCIGLQSLCFPALVTCEILTFMFAPRESTVAFHRLWAVATLVKHFKEVVQRKKV